MALSLGGTGGMQMVSQINFRLGTRGVVTGANIMNMQMDKVAQTARRAAANLSGVKQGMVDVRTAAAQASASLAGAGFGLTMLGKKITEGFTKRALEGAEGFEVAMERIRFATGATGKELQRLEKIMVQTGRETTETPTSAADAFADLRASGLDTADSLKLLRGVIQMTTGSRGLLGMGQSIRLAVSAVNKFKHTGQPFRKTLDDIAQATRETALQWENMPAFFNALRDAPMKMKATSAEMLSLGGVMKAGGMQAAESAQAIAMFADRMIINQRKMSSYLEKKGITEEDFFKIDPKELPRRMIQFQKFGISMFDAAGKSRPLTEVLVDTINKMESLQKQSDKASLTVMSGAFGTKGTSVVNMLSQFREKGESAAEAMNRLVGAVDKSDGVLKKAEDAFLRTAAGLKKLKEGTEETILITMGMTMLPILHKVVAAMKYILDSFLDFIKVHPTFAKALSITITLFGVLTLVIGALGIAAAGAIFYTQVLSLAIAEAGGIAGVAAMAMKGFKAALIGIGWTTLGLVAIFGLMYLAFRNWDSVVAWFSGPLSKSIIRFFKDVKLVAMGLVEWWNGEGGPNSMKLFEQLDERHLTGFVGFLLQAKYKIVTFFKGLWEGMKPGLKAIGTMITLVTTAISYVLEFLGILPKLFATEDLTDNIKIYEWWGKVIGAVAGVALFFYSIVLAGAGLKALMAVGAALKIVATRTFLVQGATIALVAAYFALLYLLSLAGEKLGEFTFVAIEKLKVGLREIEYEMKLLGEGMVQWLQQGFSNGWDGFVEWISAQVEFLATKVLSIFGVRTQEEVNTAWAKATKGVFEDTDKTQRRQDIIMYGEEYVERRDEQRKKIAEQAALSRANTGVGGADVEPWKRGMALSQAQSMLPSEAPKTQTFNITVKGDVTKENAYRLANDVWKQSYDQTDRLWEVYRK